MVAELGALRFRGDLEGLRGVAVALVVLYHAGVPVLAGGFVGVDVFFVLSGFLITGLIMRELEATGTLSLAAFYARRARRLLPAAMFVLAATLIASAILLPPLRVGDIAADAAAVALYVSNVRFALQATDYLQAQRDPSPLLHFWSLGVEEQFYLVWPVLLLVAWKLGRARAVVWTVVVAAAASLAGSLILTAVAAPLAFFSLPTRAWELALGGAVALASSRLRGLPRPAATTAGILGLGLVATAALSLGPRTPYPGWAALLPTLGTALVIAAGAQRVLPLPVTMLTVGLLRRLGRISYSLYLWHWPATVVPAAVIGGELPVLARLGLVAAAVPLAALTTALVEDPIRRGALMGRRSSRGLIMAGACMAVLVAVSTVTARWSDARLADVTGRPILGTDSLALARAADAARGAIVTGAVPADLVPGLSEARADVAVTYGDGCHVAVLAMRSPACVYGDASAATTVVLFGDSHAAQWFPALEELARVDRWRLVSLTKAGCPSFEVAVWNDGVGRAFDECDVWRRSAYDRIAAERPSAIVVANTDVHDLALDGAKVPAADMPDAWRAGVQRMVERVRPSTDLVLIMRDTPRSRVDVPVCLSAHLRDANACATPRGEAFAKRIDLTIDGAGIRTIDPASWICPADPCPPVVGRTLVYSDVHHITATYARSVAPLLRPYLTPRRDRP